MTRFNYKNISLYTLRDQIRFWINNFIPGLGCNRSELEAATDAAIEKRMDKVRHKRLSGEADFGWPEVPLAQDIYNISRQDWVRLEQWCVTMMDIEANLEQAWEAEQDAIGKKTAHSLDFRSVNWFGTGYSFTGNQAAAVKVLWEAWENGTPEVGGDTMAVEADSDSRRARDIFKGHPAFGTMICPGQTKGTFRLVEPDK